MAGNFRATGLEVTGSADVSSNLRVTGSVEISTNLDVVGDTTLSGDLSLLANSRLRLNNPGQNDQFVYGDNSNFYIDADNNLYLDSDISFHARVSGENVIHGNTVRTSINHDREDRDFLVNTDDYYGTILVDGGDNSVIIGSEELDNTPGAAELINKGYGADVKIMLSGSAGAKGTATRGVVLMPGDLVVSGTTHHENNVQVTGSLQVNGDISVETGHSIFFNGNAGDISIKSTNGDNLFIDADDLAFIDFDSSLGFRYGGSNRFNITSDSVYVNAGRADSDFYVNTDDYYATLFVDGNDNSIVLGHEAFDSSPAAAEVSGYGTDVKIMLSGTVGTKNTTTRGVVLMPGDVVVSGSLEIEGGLSGSLTQLVDGTSYLIAGANTTITSASNGAITIATTGGAANAFSTFAVGGQDNVVADSGTDTLTFVGAGGMTITTNAGSDQITFTSADTDTNTQNTLDQAYDEGGSGAGRTITVDSGPVVLRENSIGTGNTVLAVTGSAIFGNATSDALYPPMPGPDTNFFVSGTIGSAGSSVKGTSAFGGDVAISGSLSINTVAITTDGKLGIGTTSPSYKLEVGGNAAFGEYLYHRGDTDTFIQFADDAIGITAGGEQLITITEAGQDSVKIGDGGDVDFQVRTNGDDNTLFVQGSSDRIGIGTNAPSSIVHIKESAPTLTIQRENNSNNSSLQFMGQAGQTANMVHLGGKNDLVFSTFDGVDQEEILRLGGHYGSAFRKIIMLSGSEVGPTSMQPSVAADINFFVSGSIGHRGLASGKTAVFGGDLVVSGGIHIDSDEQKLSLGNALTYVKSPLANIMDISANILRVGADISESSNYVPADSNLFVSGAIGSKDTTTKGTAVFGGDLVVSGNLIAKNSFKTTTTYHYALAGASVANGTLQYISFKNTGQSTNGFVSGHYFHAPASGSLERIAFAEVQDTSGGNAGKIAFCMFVNNMSNNPSGQTPHGHVTASIDTAYTLLDDGATETAYRKMVDFTGVQLERTGSNTFNPGDIIKIACEGDGRTYSNATFTLVFKLNEIDPIF